MAKYKYRVLGVDPDAIYVFDSNFGGFARAQDAAENYQYNHGGWEASWPLEFEILTADEEIIERYEIERESEPVFYAYPKK